MLAVARRAVTRRAAKALTAAGAVLLAMAVTALPASARTGPTFNVQQILSGQSLGPQGETSTDGNRDSTIVEFTHWGSVIRQWDLRGKCDGIGASSRTGVVATVNEDAISFYNGHLLISASAPGTTGAAAPNPAYPAAYSVNLDVARGTASRHAHSPGTGPPERPAGFPVRPDRRAQAGHVQRDVLVNRHDQALPSTDMRLPLAAGTPSG